MLTKTEALKHAKLAQARLNRAENRATEAADERNAAFLEAQEAGVTYAELEDVSHLSTSRVNQVLSRARKSRNA
jgi:DNA-directed RNA polymerase specialized sigma24 family protein